MAVSCSLDGPPKSLMNEGEMINYLIDLHIAEAGIQNLRVKADSSKIVFAIKERQLLREHHITDSIFIKSYNYYLANPVMLEKIYSAVVDSISLRQSLVNEAK